MMSYFAIDGNYGDADFLVVMDTTQWTAEDWDAIDESSDYRRIRTAQEIQEKYNG